MKNFALICFGILLTLAVFVLLIETGKLKSPIYQESGPDSVLTDIRVSEAMNPAFLSVNEVLVFQEKLKEDYSNDSVFRSIPKDVLVNVCNVLLANDGNITKKSVVEEFRQHSNIYNNIQPQPSKLEHTITDTVVNDTAVRLESYKKLE